jgi:predicted metal-binding membrane protein
MQERGSSTSMLTAPETWRKRENLWPGLTLLVLTLTAWVYTIDQAQAMGSMAMEGMGQAPNLSLFLVSWAVMMVAMMLPAALPLILLYRVVAHKRLSPNQVLAGIVVLLIGYLGIWTIAGLPVYAYSLAATSRGTIMGFVPGLLLIGGGAYQFTALKQGCHAAAVIRSSF